MKAFADNILNVTEKLKLVFGSVENIVYQHFLLFPQYFYKDSFFFKGGYLDFSHLTELENIYITEIYMRKQNKSSKIRMKK